jgi:hypothetical protein
VEEGGGRLLPGAAGVNPTLVVCEDGSEYSDRFRRFLGGEFEFVRAANFPEALAAAPGAQGLLLDLDFRRTALLVDESGAPASRAAAEVQGILILRALRSRGVKLPAILFADLDDAGRAALLESELAPLQVVASSEGLQQIAERLRKLSNQERDR